MHDGLARQYEPDTEVIDVDDLDEQDTPYRPAYVDAEQAIARSRVSTGDLAVHIQLDDGWHRLAPVGDETACGMRVDPRRQLGTRTERLIEHPLAEHCECWTRRERERADANYLAKYRYPYQPWSKR